MMKTSKQLSVLGLVLIAAAAPRGAGAQSGKPADADQHAEAYYDFAMGHYYQQEFAITGHADDANKAIEAYKKAYALDPNSQQIGDELAEIYFQSQHIRDAVLEAQSMIAKNPDNLSARRLLARIY